MNKVIVQYVDRTQYFDNVAKVEGLTAFDMFENYIDIYQGNEKQELRHIKLLVLR